MRNESRRLAATVAATLLCATVALTVIVGPALAHDGTDPKPTTGTHTTVPITDGTIDNAEQNPAIRRAIRSDGAIPDRLLTANDHTQREILRHSSVQRAIRGNDRIRRAVMNDPKLRAVVLERIGLGLGS
jgi:hypothetical protein